jgi:hypothetical protein
VDGIEIRYAGVLLGRATQVREQGPAGLFVTFSEPLPVGTAVSLKSTEGERAGKVMEVVESADPAVAGMRVQYPAESGAASPAVPEPAAAAPATPDAVAEAHPSGPEHSGPHEGESGRRKRRRR